MSRNYGVQRHPYQPVTWRMRIDDALANPSIRAAIILIAGLAIAFLIWLVPTDARADENTGRSFDSYSQTGAVRHAAKVRRVPHGRRHARVHRAAPVLDANGNGTAGNKVCASGGRHCVTVAASARSTLQCVVDHVEAAGVRITALGGIRRGHCSTRSMHPCGKALDINQTARDVNGPPRSVSSAAASACGAVSGSWWARNPDNGHFQVGGWAGTHESTITASAHRRRHHRHHRRLARLQ